MKSNEIVRFVCFETSVSLSTEQFIAHWKQYTRSNHSDDNVILQRSENNGLFKYISQHRVSSGESDFVFEKARRSSRVPELEIKSKQAGGYSVLQMQREDDAHKGESKIIAFLSHPPEVADIHNHFSSHCKLNIYEAYYENCKYAYIMEFFVRDKYVPELLEQLKILKVDDIGVYKEFAMQES